jgi:hypothetical protein
MRAPAGAGCGSAGAGDAAGEDGARSGAAERGCVTTGRGDGCPARVAVAPFFGCEATVAGVVVVATIGVGCTAGWRAGGRGPGGSATEVFGDGGPPGAGGAAGARGVAGGRGAGATGADGRGAAGVPAGRAGAAPVAGT